MTALSIFFVLLVILIYYLRRKGKIGNFSTGIGNALFQLHTFVRPTAHYIVEAKKQRQEDAGQADDKPPELPPWAQSGD